ncbi:hypothetical protein N7468_009704 [Penicillium chermesinum]|uniref:Uncharacterized protein n=1 Tax=Penicillium chermesinum TaxID=63820 RepID=A0A9W9NIC2_9EURO|nr:uncharacterized protein N7468_009704 [Penicillium chermesinum]KAJ5220500.1 hypothetical protein N7468_009704 [Penicillium chermesinum]
MSTAWALIRSAFLSIKEAVVNLHHRQLPDLLAILLMLQRNKHTDPIHESMTRYLHLTARKYLFQDSPVRAVFESLPGLPKDPAGHLFLAYDAYCRAIWKHNTGDGGIKALWSFNQASFPRAEEGGFYEILKGMQPEDIEIQLRLVEEDWGPCSTETFSLWHMVAQWFYRNGEFRYMESFLQQLCARVHGLENEFNYAEDHQLNFNCMMSFSLLGVAQESQGDLISAMVALHRSIAIRSQIIPNGMWDPGKLAALRKLRSIVQRLGDAAQASYCTEQIDSMYASQEREDRQEQQLSGARRN